MYPMSYLLVHVQPEGLLIQDSNSVKGYTTSCLPLHLLMRCPCAQVKQGTITATTAIFVLVDVVRVCIV